MKVEKINCLNMVILIAIFFLIPLKGQTQTINAKGVVIEAETSEPIIGATVKVAGTSLGVVTDINGRFNLTGLPTDARILEISYVGMKQQKVNIQEGEIKVILSASLLTLDEVVVTAMGISRKKKALGYAMTEVKGEEMQRARGGLNNPVNALQGKVAGLQISSGSGSMGGSSKILIRGVSSISGNNQPLFIIDGTPIEGTDYNPVETQSGYGGYDYGNLVQDINPDDIENISVLKGASASALYGSRANNGVILITTKKGDKKEGMGVSFSSTVGIETVNKLPKLQKLYGGGNNQEGFSKAVINGITYNTPAYGFDESWGPKLEGQDILSWYDLSRWENGGKTGSPSTSKWIPSKHDIDDFFETGISFTNNLSITQSTERASLRVSYTNTDMKGYMPNSKMQKNMLSVFGLIKSQDKRLEVFTNISYINSRVKGRAGTGYGANNVMRQFIQWGQRQLDMDELKASYIMSDGTQSGWNRSAWDNPVLAYQDNPYWTRYMNTESDSRNRVYGNAGATYQILPWLKAQYKANLDFFVDKQFEHDAVGSVWQSYYKEISRQQYELNQEFILTANHSWGDFFVNATLGGNLMHRRYELVGGKTNGGLAIPLFYNLKNSIESPTSFNELSKRSINSIFGSISVGWKSMLYLDATLRRDHSSTLPKGNNAYLYPSVTASFLFSELLRQPVSWITYGKLRAGWAKVGNDTDPYRLLTTYKQYTNIGSGVPGYIQQTTLNNAALKPETTYSWEVGLETALFNNRLGLDFTYYSGEMRDQIVPFSVSASTGYANAVVNAGVLTNRGVEIVLRGTPIQEHSFEWNTTLTLASNQNKVKKLIDGVDYYRIAKGRLKGEIGALVGQSYGVIMGTNYIFNSDGKKMINPQTGLYLVSNGSENLGSAYPDFTGGWNNTFRLGRFDASVQIDFQKGGHYVSHSYLCGMYSGMLEETAANNIREEGIVLGGVIDEKGTPNTTVVKGQAYGKFFDSGPLAMSVLSTDYIKLREVTVGYTFHLAKKHFIKLLRLSAYGRNLGVWGPDTKHFDPEMIVTGSGNVQGLEGGATPSVANYGMTVNLKF